MVTKNPRLPSARVTLAKTLGTQSESATANTQPLQTIQAKLSKGTSNIQTRPSE